MTEDWNPTPPSELANVEDYIPDRIGQSVFSKQWVIKTLMNAIKSAEIEGADADLQMDVTELDSQIENEMCVLWDASVDKDIALFIEEFNAADIFIGIINQTKSPRLIEICIGILANIACFPEICTRLADQENLRELIFLLWIGSTDSPTLIQVLRLFNALLHTEKSECLFQAARESEPFLLQVKFILSNSLNDELLKNTLSLLFTFFDNDEDLCNQWCDAELVSALATSATQMRSTTFYSGLNEFCHIVHILTQKNEFPEIAGNKLEELLQNIQNFIIKFADRENFPPWDHLSAMAAAASSLTRIRCWTEIEDNFLSILKNLQELTMKTLSKARRKSSSEEIEDVYLEHLDILNESIQVVLSHHRDNS